MPAAVARQVAHITYRSAEELAVRFGRVDQAGESVAGGGRYAVESYLDHQGDKLIGRFDAGSYVILTEAMNSHDVGRGRGGVEAALARVTARTVVAGIDSDRLYPVAESERLAAGIPTADPLVLVNSDHGHDGFLIEVDAVGKLVADLLSQEIPGLRCTAHEIALALRSRTPSGSPAVGWEAYSLLAEAGEAVAYVDTDYLGFCFDGARRSDRAGGAEPGAVGPGSPPPAYACSRLRHRRDLRRPGPVRAGDPRGRAHLLPADRPGGHRPGSDPAAP